MLTLEISAVMCVCVTPKALAIAICINVRTAKRSRDFCFLFLIDRTIYSRFNYVTRKKRLDELVLSTDVKDNGLITLRYYAPTD